jgi:hypothetical protein
MEFDVSKDLLPVGTIVKVRFSKYEYMIFGFYIRDPEENKVYDYMAIPYPHGLLNLNDTIGLDRDMIKKVVHLGYINEEEKEYKKEIEEERKKGNIFNNETV